MKCVVTADRAPLEEACLEDILTIRVTTLARKAGIVGKAGKAGNEYHFQSIF